MNTPSEKINHHSPRERAQIAKIELKSFFEYRKFTKKQKKLLLALTILKPVSIIKLEIITKSKNIKSLVRDTNKRLKRNKFYPQMRVVSCYNKFNKLKGYYYLIFSPLSK